MPRPKLIGLMVSKGYSPWWLNKSIVEAVAESSHPELEAEDKES